MTTMPDRHAERDPAIGRCDRRPAPSANASGQTTAPTADAPGQGTAPWLALGALGAVALAACADGSGDGAPAGGQPAGVQAKAAEVGTAPVFRFAKISNGAYFYTGNAGEKDLVLRDYPDFRYEGWCPTSRRPRPACRCSGCNSPTAATLYQRPITVIQSSRNAVRGARFRWRIDAQGVSPVYRLANLGNGAYLFTSSAPERDAAVATGLWRAEGIVLRRAHLAVRHRRYRRTGGEVPVAGAVLGVRRRDRGGARQGLHGLAR
jgi:hypothetical protein